MSDKVEVKNVKGLMISFVEGMTTEEVVDEMMILTKENMLLLSVLGRFFGKGDDIFGEFSDKEKEAIENIFTSRLNLNFNGDYKTLYNSLHGALLYDKQQAEKKTEVPPNVVFNDVKKVD